MNTPDPTKAESSALDRRNPTKTALILGAFPVRHNTVTAEVLARLLNGEHLTGMDAVFCASTTRLAAVIDYLEKCYDWDIDRCDIDVGTKDGRISVISAYYLQHGTIRAAFAAGAMKFCHAVKSARAKTRKHAPKAMAEAAKRNAARALGRFNPRQRSLFGAAHE